MILIPKGGTASRHIWFEVLPDHSVLVEIVTHGDGGGKTSAVFDHPSAIYLVDYFQREGIVATPPLDTEGLMGRE